MNVSCIIWRLYIILYVRPHLNFYFLQFCIGSITSFYSPQNCDLWQCMPSTQLCTEQRSGVLSEHWFLVDRFHWCNHVGKWANIAYIFVSLECFVHNDGQQSYVMKIDQERLTIDLYIWNHTIFFLHKHTCNRCICNSWKWLWKWLLLVCTVSDQLILIHTWIVPGLFIVRSNVWSMD